MADGSAFQTRQKARLFLAAQFVGGLSSLAAGIWFLTQENLAGPNENFGWGLAAGVGWTAAYFVALWTYSAEGGLLFKSYDPATLYRLWSRDTWRVAVGMAGCSSGLVKARVLVILLWLAPFLAFPFLAIRVFSRNGDLDPAFAYGIGWVVAFMIFGMVAQWRWSAWINHLRAKGLAEKPSYFQAAFAYFRYWPLSYKPVHDEETEALRKSAAVWMIIFLVVWLGGFLMAPVVWSITD